jgi:hypothetical protein
MPSFDAVNYSVRLRKNIERKLIAELLQSMGQTFTFSNYQYVGMGSLWFSDFLVMHKALNIRKMWSIEKFSPKRASFNNPFGFIKVLPGDIKDELPKLMNGESRSIVWLDYDHDLKDGIVGDLLQMGRHASCGDVFIVTANAHPGQIRPPTIGNVGAIQDGVDKYLDEIISASEISQSVPASSLGPILKEAISTLHTLHVQNSVEEKNKILQSLTNGVIPGSFSNQDFSERKFPQIVAKALINALNSACRSSGKKIKFVPIFNFFYQDGAPMVTVGGIVVDQAHEEKLQSLKLSEKFFFATGDSQVSIDVPHLTPQEKLKLDSLLTENNIDPVAGDLNFEIDNDSVINYCRFYKQYPLFSEIF